MKNGLFIFIVFTFIGCEPSYHIYIRNSSSSDLYLKTYPSIESFYEPYSSYYQKILIYRFKQEGKYSIYKIKASDTTFMIDGHLGVKPTINEISFEYIELISGSDTTILDSKGKILEQIKQGNKKGNYYIEIVK